MTIFDTMSAVSLEISHRFKQNRLSTHSKTVMASIPGSRPFRLGSLWLLSIGVNVRANGCLSLYISPELTGDLFGVYPAGFD